MNGARSTFMRKGYWITALAAIVLLAASPGTASAQSATFSTTSVTVEEGASSDMDTGAPQIVDINISNLTFDGEETTNKDGLGMLTLVHDADLDPVLTGDNRRVWVLVEGSTALDVSEQDPGLAAAGKAGINDRQQIHYNKNGVIRLAIIDPAADDNWQEDTFTMALRLSGDVPLGASVGPPAKVTITDINAAPVVKFSPASIKLTERSQTTATVTVGPGDNTNTIPGDVSMITTQLRLMVSHPDIVMTGMPGGEVKCPVPNDKGIVMAITGKGVSELSAGSFEVNVDDGGVGSAAMQDGIMLTIEACDETMDFRNAMVVLTPTASSLKLMTGGPGSISAGAGLSIDVESDEEVPVVTFSTSSLNVDEEDDTSVYIVTTTGQGDEVGAVNVRVGGDALITLSQKGTALTANTDGTYTADFGMDANTRLMISADADESLHEGDQKVATVTIVDAGGYGQRRDPGDGSGAGSGRPGGHAERRFHGDRGGRHDDDHRDGQPIRHG